MTDALRQNTGNRQQKAVAQLVGIKLDFFMRDNLGHEPDLAPVQRAIEKEKAMLHPSLEELQQSWRDGLTVIAIVNGEVVGHLRLCKLLDGPLKQRLNLPKDFPEIWETGSGWVHPDYRDTGGIFTQMRYMLLDSQINEIKSKRLLVLGTTKHIAVIKGVRTSAERLGLEFEFVRHLKYPFVAAFTCVCTGELGTGMHSELECPQRTSEDQLVDTLRRADAKRAINGNGNGNSGSQLPVVSNNDGWIMCSMYVSDKELAQSIDNQLRALPEFGGDPMRMSGKLRSMGYYGLVPAQ